MDITQFIKNGKLKVMVKPSSSENKILGYDKSKEAVKIAINAVPSRGEANKELLKFLKKKFKLNCIIKSGHKSKEKILEII